MIKFIKLKALIKIYLFRLNEYLFGYPHLKKQFRKKTGYDLNLKYPRSFNEKINWKKIYDRNPLLPIVSDKLKVRSYLIKQLGAKRANEILIPLLYHTDNPEKISFEKLPEQFMIKATHGSGANKIITSKTLLDKDELIRTCKKWLDQPYGAFKHEWSYQNIKPRIIIEEFIQENGESPIDYKFHMIHNNCEFIQVIQRRVGKEDERKMSFYDTDWKKLNIYREYPHSRGFVKPTNFQEMLELAETLSKCFDYIRVDLYSIGERVYFGELTNYPASGEGRYKPQSFDFELGEKWTLRPKYWLDESYHC